MASGSLAVRSIGTRTALVYDNEDAVHILADFSYNLTAESEQTYIEAFTQLYNNLQAIVQETEESVHPLDVVTVVGTLMGYQLRTNGKNIRMLDMGPMDVSVVFQAKALQMFSDTNKLYVLQHWQAWSRDQLARLGEAYDLYHRILVKQQADSLVQPLFGGIQAQQELLPGSSFDLVFVKEERYGALIHSIVQAVKKLKPGGLLIGRNCECYYRDLPAPLRNKGITLVEWKDGEYHTGVIFALKVLFNDEYERPIPGSSIWRITVTEALQARILKDFVATAEMKQLQLLVETGHELQMGLNRLLMQGPDAGVEALDERLSALGHMITGCEKLSSELAYATGYVEPKRASVLLKSDYADAMMNQRTDQELPDLAEVRQSLQLWMQSLEGCRAFLNRQGGLA